MKKEVSEWNKPTTWIALAALVTTWAGIFSAQRSINHRLDGISSAVRTLAINQASGVQFAIEKDLDTKVSIPKIQLNQAQDSAKLLAKVAPDYEQTWATVAAVASYRSAALQSNPFADIQVPECTDGPGQTGSNIPLQVAAPVLAKYRDLNIVSSCTIHLDKVLARDTGAIFFINAVVIYDGGSLQKGRTLIFYHCTFKLHSDGIPPIEGQTLLLASLDSQPTEVFTVRGGL